MGICQRKAGKPLDLVFLKLIVTQNLTGKHDQQANWEIQFSQKRISR